ncbi:MAG: Adenylosuccinate lyase [Myxococcota bacterium]|nr:Adenylosuccinate lyase [Myxococcota bacterium]
MIPRYAHPEMTAIWEPAEKFRVWLDIELEAARAMAARGDVDSAAFAGIEGPLSIHRFTPEDIEEIDAIERTVKHDVIAFLTFIENRYGAATRILHFGMTSSDVLDTSLAVLLTRAGRLLRRDRDAAMEAVKSRALEHRLTPMIGRSHGVHAEPITFGLKLAGWYDELQRGRHRLVEAIRAVGVGKISGAVGTFANVHPEVEARVMKRLGLMCEPAATQVVHRDRHAQFFGALALIGASLERFVVEIRHLQRTEVREAEEFFSEGQKGSSAMPHKRNPVLSENITGLARLLRGYALAALENVPLWHERDISHSSVERIIAPDATVTLDFALRRFTGLVKNLVVYPERMRQNLEAAHGVIFSQRVLLELARRGAPRQQAYVIVQRNAQRAFLEGKSFESLLLQDADLLSMLDADTLRQCFSLDTHLRHVDEIFRRVFGDAHG